MTRWAFLLGLATLVGCTDPDPYYRIEKVTVCAFTPVIELVCENNPACNRCLDANGFLQAVYQADGCQVAGSVGVTLCVNDCSVCDSIE
jgi:hypothetical protein